MNKKLLYVSAVLALLISPQNVMYTYAETVTQTEGHPDVFDAKTFYLIHAFSFHDILQKIRACDIETKKLYENFIENFYKNVEFVLARVEQKDYSVESEGLMNTPEFKKFVEDVKSVGDVRMLVDSKILEYEQKIQNAVNDKFLEEKKKSLETLKKLKEHIKVDGADVEKFIPTVLEVYDELFHTKN